MAIFWFCKRAHGPWHGEKGCATRTNEDSDFQSSEFIIILWSASERVKCVVLKMSKVAQSHFRRQRTEFKDSEIVQHVPKRWAIFLHFHLIFTLCKNNVQYFLDALCTLGTYKGQCGFQTSLSQNVSRILNSYVPKFCLIIWQFK